MVDTQMLAWQSFTQEFSLGNGDFYGIVCYPKIESDGFPNACVQSHHMLIPTGILHHTFINFEGGGDSPLCMIL